MFKYILGLFLLVSASVANAGLPVCTSGAFFEPVRGGEGVLLTVSSGMITGGWFTYDYANANGGVPVKTWYSLGPVANTNDLTPVTLPVYETKALSNVFDPLVVNTQLIGSATFRFVDASTVVFSYTIGSQVFPLCDFGPFPFYCSRNDVVLARASSVVPCN